MSPINIRPGQQENFAFCERLYLEGMDELTRQLGFERAGQIERFTRQWVVGEVLVVECAGVDVGWAQLGRQDNDIFLKQLFVDAPSQRRGIGSEVLRRLIDDAVTDRRAVVLGVMKRNPAKALYERFGFRVTHEDDYKFYMRREPD